MTCQQFVDFILSYLEGEGDPQVRAVFDEHVSICPPCLAYLDSYRDTVALGRAVCVDPDGPVPDDVPEALVVAVLAARRQARS
jgi:anti-sigma factor RsiW